MLWCAMTCYSLLQLCAIQCVLLTAIVCYIAATRSQGDGSVLWYAMVCYGVLLFAAIHMHPCYIVVKRYAFVHYGVLWGAMVCYGVL